MTTKSKKYNKPRFRVRNHQTLIERDNPEKDFGPSLTIQSEAYTIRELFERAVRGGFLDEEIPDSQFMDPQEVEEINKFYGPDIDLTDLAALRQHTANMYEKLKNVQDKIATRKQEEAAMNSRQSQNENIPEAEVIEDTPKKTEAKPD